MFLLSHPTGNQNMRHSALALLNAAALSEVWTCVSWNPDGTLATLMPKSLRTQVERRSFPAALRPHLHGRPWREMARLACQRFGLKNPIRHEFGWCSIDAVYRDLDQRVAARLLHARQLRGVYAYEDAAVATFRVAKQLGLRRVYDLPIGYWRAFGTICAEEEQREPQWAGTLVGNLDSPEKHERKDQEIADADHLVVASSFTRSTLASYPGTLPTMSVVPYGAPAVDLTRERQWSANGPLRVLYVGSLSQRKGISYLFAAIATIDTAVNLTVIGSQVAECAVLNTALTKHNYIPSLPHAQILEHMRSHDVLVFPSLFEGFGLVITEAMSQGMVVITTPHTAGPDLITDGHDGFIVPIRDAQAITDRLLTLADDRARLTAMGQAALVTAHSRTWNGFHHALQSALGLPTSPLTIDASPTSPIS